MERILNLFLVFCIVCKCATSQITTFTNPILDTPIRGSSIIKIDNFYYLVHADNGNNELEILKSSFLTDFRWAEKQVMYKLPSGFDSLFSTAFLEYENDLYFYFHMSFHSVNSMYVIKSEDSKNPFGNWSTHVPVLDQIWNEAAIHGAPFELNNQLHFVWTSPSQENSKWNFYIAKMQSATKATEPVALLREPNDTWECHGTCTVHAPSFLYNGDKMYMIFSASSSSVPETSISYMSIRIGLDPMHISNWESAQNPAFEGCPEENVYSTRFPEFTTSPDNSETWMLYTASSDSSNINPSSRLSIGKLEWNLTDGKPQFPPACGKANEQELPSGEPSKFLNPLRDDGVLFGPDVYRVGSFYYTVSIAGSELIMLKSDKLYDFRNAEQAVIYQAPPGWAPYIGGRIQEINGEVYIYFCMSRASPTVLHQMFVLKCEDKSNLMQNWGNSTRLLQGLFNGHAFSGTTWEHNQRLYFVWNHLNTRPANVIYIAPMSSPTEVVGPVVLLKEPKQSWECSIRCFNQHPAFLVGKNITHLIFSAGGYNIPDSSLSFISIANGNDPLNLSSWSAAPGPVFVKNDDENVFAIFTAAFTTSPDGTENWMIYRAADTASNVVDRLTMRIQKIVWKEETGELIFPMAHGLTYKQAIPSNCEVNA